jgi:hypothetical protein
MNHSILRTGPRFGKRNFLPLCPQDADIECRAAAGVGPTRQAKANEAPFDPERRPIERRPSPRLANGAGAGVVNA